MKLPNAENAVISPAKIVDYLLSPTHRDGQHKFRFFSSFGFRQNNWQFLAEALREHARKHGVSKVESAPYGRRYVVEGIMDMPDGRSVELRSIWYIRHEENFPRFVTAYPLHKSF